MDATEQKTLAQMTAEVVENNTAKGWYENCATFPEAMAMLHSEVSEALEAWRKHGLEDQTRVRLTCDDPQCGDSTWDHECDPLPGKPEGVGSEFADIFIRLLDDAWLFGKLDMDAELARLAGAFAVSDSFPHNMNTMHTLIASASMAWSADDNFVHWFVGIFQFLYQLCEEYGIDLPAEYERKAAYNRSRPYRHGGKRI